MANLYIVATPIGNLEDLTFRAARVLKDVSLVLCEDTRQTKKLLEHYQIDTPTLSYHQHSKINKINLIIDKLYQGKDIALVSDSGSPGISDPGNYLVSKVVSESGEKIKIIPIPGPSAVTALASVSGLPTDRFLFLGFLPHKKGRQTLIKEIINSSRTVLLYESTHRIDKLLDELINNGVAKRQLVVGRELTKKFETIYRGTAEEIKEKLGQGSSKGEFTIVIEKK